MQLDELPGRRLAQPGEPLHRRVIGGHGIPVAVPVQRLLSAADGSGEGGTTGHKLTVGFQGRTPNSSGGPSALPSLPAKGVYYDSSLSATYWLRDMDDALSY